MLMPRDLLTLLIPVAGMTVSYIVFVNVSKIKFNKFETLCIILATVGFHELLVFYVRTIPDADATIFSMLRTINNASLIVIMSIAAYMKTRILPLSIFYAVLARIIALLGSILINPVVAYFFTVLSRQQFTPASWIIAGILNILSVISPFVVSIPLSYLAGNILHKKICHFDNDVKSKFAIYMLIGAFLNFALFLFLGFLSGIIFYDNTVLNIAFTLFIIAFSIFLAFVIFVFTDKFQKEIESKYHKESLKNLQAYADDMENMAVKIKSFRHDNKNLLLGFYEHIENKDWDGVGEYYDKYMLSFTKNTTTDDSPVEELANLKIPELKSLLLLKFLFAQQQGIGLHIEISEEIENIGEHNLIDLCRIAGILLDNAIEACLGLDKPVLSFMALKDGSETIFVFANTCFKPPPLSKIFEKGFTTKEGSRGIGLYSILVLMEENENLSLSTHIDDRKFIQKLIVSVG